MLDQFFKVLLGNIEVSLILSFLFGSFSLIISGFRLEPKSATRSHTSIWCEMLYSYIATFFIGWREQRLLYSMMLIIILFFGWLMFLLTVLCPFITRIKKPKALA